MAESTIPDAGLGVFTAIEKKIGHGGGDGDVLDHLNVGVGDVCMPIYKLDWRHPDTFCPCDDDVWDREVMGLKMESTLSKKVPDPGSRNSR